MKYVYVYHSAEVIDTFVFNQSHCVPVVRPLMVHNNKHSAYYQVHCRTRTTFSHYFQETWHCPENRRLCQWLEKTKSKRLRTFSYEVMQDINNGVQCHWMNLSTAKKKKKFSRWVYFVPHLGGWKGGYLHIFFLGDDEFLMMTMGGSEQWIEQWVTISPLSSLLVFYLHQVDHHHWPNSFSCFITVKNHFNKVIHFDVTS